MNHIGAHVIPGEGCKFKVWAPEKKSMILRIVHPEEMELSMIRDEDGYFSLTVDGIGHGCRYFYKPDGENTYPDPASCYQPEGVHGPSEVFDHSRYAWNDSQWKGVPMNQMVICEIHTGTYTSEGTFEAMIPHLDKLAGIGINTIELMPVSQFPGNRNWGYDGVYPFAVQNSYGGPDALKKLVDNCHQRGIAVLLDVVYNHLGPEGNYLSKFGPYFTKKYLVPWGEAVNFDDEWCDGVRDFFSSNPIYWFEKFHIDGLRVDAIHTIYDTGAVHFWEYTYGRIKHLEQQTGRKYYMIAESDLNSPRVVKPPEVGGFGFDAQWLDDFHHALYVLLDKNGRNRYEDFGMVEQLAKAYTDGFVHSGELVRFRKRKHGASSAGIDGEKFIAFNQNHDQAGNRVLGERLSELVNFPRLKLAAGALFFSPYVPMLFMGEEYGEDNPFFYFVSHTDKNLIKAVKEGRKKEFAGYRWQVEPPDPQAEKTFTRSKIDLHKQNTGKYRIIAEWHKELIRMRKTLPELQNTSKNDIRAFPNRDTGLLLWRRSEDEKHHLLCFLNFSENEEDFFIPAFAENWNKILDSEDMLWQEYPSDSRKNNTAPARRKAGQMVAIKGCSIVVYRNE